MANPVVGSAVAGLKRLQDLILWEIETRYCRRMVVLTGVDGAGSVVYPIGRVLKLDSGGEGTALGTLLADANTVPRYILAERVVIVDDGTAEVAVVERGPCLINQDELVWPATESSNDIAAQQAHMTTNYGIKFVKEPLVQSSGGLD